MVTIKVIPDIAFNFGSPLSELLRVCAEIEKAKTDVVTIDLGGCRFSSPLFLLGIHLLYRQGKDNGRNIHLNLDCTNKAFAAYLTLTFFRDGFKPDDYPIEEYNKFFDTYRSKTYLPLTSFPAGQDSAASAVRETVLEFMSNRIKERLAFSGQLYSAVAYLLDEAVNNTRDHSRTDRGYLFTQFYPSKNYLDVCIADTGASILGSYQAVGRTDILNHGQAMQAALTGDSTKADPNRGFGIRTSRRMLVQGLGGHYFLWSGNAFLYSAPGAAEVVSVMPEHAGIQWPGTYIALRIPVQKNVKFQVSDYLEP